VPKVPKVLRSFVADSTSSTISERTHSATSARDGPNSRENAEGFARYKHKDFARCVRIAKGSEAELLNHFQEAFDDGYLTDSERRALEHAARKAIRAANGLIRYLDSTPDPSSGELALIAAPQALQPLQAPSAL
jgi:hypothetical protein